MSVSAARILISNDDGINASGLKILEKVARELSDDVWVVAPESEQSGAGHSLTLTRPLRVRKLEEKRFAVDGTPTDCVMMAVNQIMKDSLPTLVLSGVNRGGNLAEDVTYSGTVSVAMEGTLCGIPSIAMSQCIRPPARTKWETAEKICTGCAEAPSGNRVAERCADQCELSGLCALRKCRVSVLLSKAAAKCWATILMSVWTHVGSPIIGLALAVKWACRDMRPT